MGKILLRGTIEIKPSHWVSNNGIVLVNLTNKEMKELGERFDAIKSMIDLSKIKTINSSMDRQRKLFKEMNIKNTIVLTKEDLNIFSNILTRCGVDFNMLTETYGDLNRLAFSETVLTLKNAYHICEQFKEDDYVLTLDIHPILLDINNYRIECLNEKEDFEEQQVEVIKWVGKYREDILEWISELSRENGLGYKVTYKENNFYSYVEFPNKNIMVVEENDYIVYDVNYHTFNSIKESQFKKFYRKDDR